MIDGNKKWLVTGASGFLGANFTPAMDTLVALTRTNNLPLGYDSNVIANLENEQQLRAAIQRVKPDYILHAAALSSHEECELDPVRAFLINEQATRVLAQEAESVGAKFIYISTDAVFDGKQGNYFENDPTNPFSVYGESKLAGEIAATQETNPLVIRTNFFGWSPSGTRSILEFFVNNLEANLAVPGFTDFTVTSLYVRRCAEIIRHVKQEPGIWHVTSSDALSKYNFGLEVAKVFDLDPDLITARTSREDATHQVSRSRDISLNTLKIQKFLNHEGGPSLQTQREGILQAKRERGLVL